MRRQYNLPEGCPVHSPWGAIDNASIIAPGIFQVSTPSHGGIKLDRDHNAAIPDYMRREGGWYEEDCDWCIPFIVFEAEIILAGDQYALKNITAREHYRTFLNWHPDAYERFTQTEIKPGESFQRDAREWKREHANDLQVNAAWGSYRDNTVPEGMVGVKASVGGRDNYGQGKERWFLVPAAEYEARNHHGFIVDPLRHIEVQDFTKAPAA